MLHSHRPMSDEPGTQWNQRHAEAEGIGEPAEVLLRNLQLLPSSGVALDLACGRGANALRLVEAGLEVHAWDRSPVAIQRLNAEAQARGLSIRTQVRDVLAQPPAANSFDLILVSHFLERELLPRLATALRPGGLLFYQTFIQEVMLNHGPKCSQWRLANNELLHAFPGLRLHYYREEGARARPGSPLADMAMLVASREA